jgi:hypothetical protein
MSAACEVGGNVIWMLQVGRRANIFIGEVIGVKSRES